MPSDLRVLLVDDDPLVRRCLVRCLRPIAEVVDVASGEAALMMLSTSERFDVIVADVGLGGMSGVELFDELRRDLPEMVDRFVAISGLDHSDTDPAFCSALGSRLLMKPISPRALCDLVLAVACSNNLDPIVRPAA